MALKLGKGVRAKIQADTLLFYPLDTLIVLTLLAGSLIINIISPTLNAYKTFIRQFLEQ